MLLAGLVGLLSGAGLPVSQAVAAEGVHFDPNSPAGKEYALPLDQARNEASGGGGTQKEAGGGGESGEAAPLFGAGVSGPGATAAGGTGNHHGGASPGTEPGQEASKPSTAPERGGSQLGPAALDSGGGYPLASGVGLVALIVLVGVGLGLAFRGIRRAAPG